MAKRADRPSSARKKPTAPKKPRGPGTRAPKAARAVPAAAAEASDPAHRTALEVARLALDKKALDVVVLDLRGLSSYAECLVVMTAESDPQLHAIADHVETRLKEQGVRPLSIEGARRGRWVLLDYGDVVAHVFLRDTREFYDIEGLWADAARTAVRD